MIQLGSILAVMWLYRAKIISVVARPARRPGRAAVRADGAGRVPAGARRRALLDDFVEQVLARAPRHRGGVHRRRHRDAARGALRPRRRRHEADRTPLARAFGIGVCQTLALIPGVSRSGATIVGARAAGTRPRRGRRVLVFSRDADDDGRVRLQAVRREGLSDAASAALEIAVGFVMAFLAALVVVRPFLAFVARSGFAPFAWYRIAAGRRRFCVALLERGLAVMQWLRRRFLAGFFVIVPLVISVFALVWIFGIIDGFTAPLVARICTGAGRLPGCSRARRSAVTLLLVLLVGAVATNVIGRRVLARAESWLMMIPGFRTIYAPVKQLVVGVLAGQRVRLQARGDGGRAARGLGHGFLTKEFTVDRGHGPEPLMAVYVPTNHLYLGESGCIRRERAFFPDLTVEEGIRIFLTGGMSLPGHCTGDRRPRRRSPERGAMSVMSALKGLGRLGCGDGAVLIVLVPALSGSAVVWRRQPGGRRRRRPRRSTGLAARPTRSCPIWSSVDVGGYNGRTLLLIGLLVSRRGHPVRSGHPQSAQEPAGARVDARDLRADLRDLQDLPGHPGQVHRHPRNLHRRRDRPVFRRAARASSRCASSSSCSSASSAFSAATAWRGSASG